MRKSSGFHWRCSVASKRRSSSQSLSESCATGVSDFGRSKRPGVLAPGLYAFMKRVNVSWNSGCQRDRAGRLWMMSSRFPSDQLRRPLQGGLLQIGETDAHPPLRERHGRGQTDAARAPSDHGDFGLGDRRMIHAFSFRVAERSSRSELEVSCDP